MTKRLRLWRHDVVMREDNPAWPWKPRLNWDTPAGVLLQQLGRLLEGRGEFEIVVFGSAPLQLTLDASFLSADVDLISADDLTGLIHEAGLGKGQRPFYLEQTPANVFRSSPAWRLRAHTESQGSVRWIFPHPVDILVAKIPRCAPKDLNAFALVMRETGHPSEGELKAALAEAVDIFRPGFDEENPAGDPVNNVRQIWNALYGKEIDVRAEIIRPALEARRQAFGEDVQDIKSELNRRADS
ncbi:MAG: hypothetical protein SFU85_08460 [Candidatus Methylacidiphilales bacterium]|nr:hypothetical protein [Candidatus Methylacidiphilales bacterium]